MAEKIRVEKPTVEKLSAQVRRQMLQRMFGVIADLASHQVSFSYASIFMQDKWLTNEPLDFLTADGGE